MTETITWRDVRDAVHESEVHILTAIAAMEVDYKDHEERLRRVENLTGGARAVMYALVGALSAIGIIVAIAKAFGALS